MAYNEKCGKLFCCEDISLVENFDIASRSEEVYEFHHRKETDLGVSRKWLVEHNLYYHRPASELILLTSSEHTKLHMTTNPPWLGKKLTEEHKKKISKAHTGKKLSAETRRKMSEQRQANPYHCIKICPLILYTMNVVKGMGTIEISKSLGIERHVITRKLKKYKIGKFSDKI